MVRAYDSASWSTSKRMFPGVRAHLTSFVPTKLILLVLVTDESVMAYNEGLKRAQ